MSLPIFLVNTAQAVATLFDLARDVNRLSDEGYSVAQGQQLLLELANMLGLTLKPVEKPPLDTKALEQLAGSTTERLEKAGQSQLSKDFWSKAALFILGSHPESLLQLLISTRDQLREAKQWQLADEIRAKLTELGIALEDTPQGTIWKHKR